METKLSFVILTWNSEATIDACLTSIEDSCSRENIPYEVFIVDNGSRDGTCSIIERFGTMPIRLTCHTKNRGTTTTRNEALRMCTGEVVCILDSDASFVEGSLRELMAKLLADRSIGILAPKLIERDGKVQASVKKFPSVVGKIARIPRILFKMNMADAGIYPDFPFDDVREVDCAISACWFFRRSLLDDVGFLDERIFYAPEDVDFCLRVRKTGKKLVYDPAVTVLHQTQQITHKRVLSKVALSHFFGLMYYFIKHRYVTSPSIPHAEQPADRDG